MNIPFLSGHEQIVINIPNRVPSDILGYLNPGLSPPTPVPLQTRLGPLAGQDLRDLALETLP